MAFSYYKSLTLAEAQSGTANSTDWPLTISLDGNVQAADADLKTVGNGGYVQNANGYDIRPYADSGLTSALTFELVFYNGATGALEMHVKIPTLSASTDTVIYLAFGDSGLSTNGSSTSTWNSNYKGVFHFPNGSSLATTDSTAGAHNGTAQGTTAPVAGAGQMDGGASYTGGIEATDEIIVSSAIVNLTVGTVSVWGKPAYNMPGTFVLDYEYWFDTDGTRHAFFQESDDNPSRIAMYVDGRMTTFSSISWTINTWHHFVFAYNKTGNVQRFFMDGVEKTGDTPSGTWGSTALGTNAHIGNRISSVGGLITAPAGILDEVRTSDIVLTQSWITADFNSQKASSNFITWGTRTAVSGGSLIKTKKGLAIASVKTFKGLAKASVKTDKGLTNV